MMAKKTERHSMVSTRSRSVLVTQYYQGVSLKSEAPCLGQIFVTFDWKEDSFLYSYPVGFSQLDFMVFQLEVLGITDLFVCLLFLRYKNTSLQSFEIAGIPFRPGRPAHKHSTSPNNASIHRTPV